MNNTFKNVVLIKSFLFLLIVLWGGYNTTSIGIKSGDNFITDLGNLLFMVFSVFYLLNAFFLLKFKSLGSRTYLPLILLFIVLGFISEVLNPVQINRDYFYLIIFYVVSPLFFITQGMVLSMLISKSFREKFQ